MAEQFETATFGGGCFWCTEAVYQQLRGVKSVTSGYCGGSVRNPSYEQVCSKRTGHAEVVQVVFDPPWNQQMMSEAAKLELGML